MPRGCLFKYQNYEVVGVEVSEYNIDVKAVTYKISSQVSFSDSAALQSYAESSNEVARFCYHDSEVSDLHVMLICMPSNKSYPVHRHLDSDENVTINQGDLYISFYSEQGKQEESFHLQPQEQAEDSNFSLLLKRGQWHSVRSGHAGAVFVEVKLGPFDKSKMEIFPETRQCDSNEN